VLDETEFQELVERSNALQVCGVLPTAIDVRMFQPRLPFSG
jgi:hypothetical protein